MLISRLVASLCVLVTACSGSTRSQNLEVATTTSVVNSGLLEVLAPAFLSEEQITVRPHAAGSGRALEMLNDRVVDLVISHAPQAEARMLKLHPEWKYQKIATNVFLIVGPSNDPADVRHAANVVEAMARIAAKRAWFVSRGDGSGTNEREMELWTLGGQWKTGH